MAQKINKDLTKDLEYKKPKGFLLGRSIFLALLFVIIMNFVFLVPSLNSVRDRVFEHQLEITEKVHVEISHETTQRAKDITNNLASSMAADVFSGEEFDYEVKDFLADKKDLVEFSISDLSGNQRVHVYGDGTIQTEGLRNISNEAYFKKAVEEGSYIETSYSKDQKEDYIISSKRIIFNNEKTEAVAYVKLNLKESLKGYAEELLDDDNETVYVIDVFGNIIDHYNKVKIGGNVHNFNTLKGDFLKGGVVINSDQSYSSQDGNNQKIDDYFQESYTNETGKVQATARFFGDLGMAIVVEEPYQEAWGAWQQIFILSTAGIMLFSLLSIFLVKTTISITYTSSELFRKKKQTEAIVSNLVSGIIQYDSNMRILLINPKAEEILGVKKKDVIGKVITTDTLREDKRYASLVKVLYPALADSVKKIIGGGEHKVLEMRISKPKDADIQVTTIPMYESEGGRTEYLKVIRDISREKAISRTKSEFISIAAHQLRTPLSAIKWIFKMLIDGDVGEVTKEQKDFIQKGYDSNERIINLVNDMLNVARIEEGRFGYEFYYIDIIELIKKVIKEFSLKAEEKNIKLVLKVTDKKLDPVKIDPARIDLVLQNLVDNALKYTRIGGTITIGVDKLDEYLEITVQDSGVGIPEPEVEKLFSKFYRGSNVIKMQTEGSGLGLFITKNIIERHGGKIWVETQEGRGTKFYFTLPAKESLIPSGEDPADEVIDL